MFASSPRVMPITAPTVRPKRRLRNSLRLTINLMLSLMKAGKALSLERKVDKPLFKHSPVFTNGMPTSALPMRFQTPFFQINSI
jgi:hypothetical protein